MMSSTVRKLLVRQSLGNILLIINHGLLSIDKFEICYIMYINQTL